MVRFALLALWILGHALLVGCDSGSSAPTVKPREELAESRRVWAWGQDKKAREKIIAELNAAENINEAERALRIYELKLQDYAVTLDHYTMIVMDRLEDRNTGYAAEISDVGEIMLMNSATKKHMTFGLAREQQRSGDPTAIIDSLLARAEKEIGPPPRVAPLDPLRRAGLRDKPFLPAYRQSGIFMQRAEEAHRRGARDEAIQLLRQAIEIRAVYLGTRHPETLKVLAVYDHLRTPQRTVTPSDLADEELRKARELWHTGDIEGAIEHGEKAFHLRKMQHGDRHESVEEIRTMLSAARERLQREKHSLATAEDPSN